MPPRCEPLCCFDDRLYFTTFPAPAPDPGLLNRDDVPRPKVRARNHHGARPVPADDGAPYYYFTVDDQLVYLSFFQDWGPLNLAMVYKACILFHELLQDEELADHRLVLYSSDDPRRKANAALLVCLYVMIVQRRPPWEAFHPIAELEIMPFRDAGRGPSDFNLSIQDCLWGMWKAMQNGLCDMNEFSVDEYEFYEKVENGDWNWITPGFIAFASPVDPAWVKAEKDRKARAEGEGVHLPDDSKRRVSNSGSLQRKLPTPFLNCLDYFEKKNVRMVVRLNTELYDRQVFLDQGIDHVDLYFDDGTNPTDEITRSFIDLSDEIISNGGAVAVHCKAGLGRTGTLIGAYMIWKYGFTANEAIAFMRIVRPGSVVGPQQHFMYLKQLEWTKWSVADEMRKTRESEQAATAPQSHANGTIATSSSAPAIAPTIVTPATPPAEADHDEPRGMIVDFGVEHVDPPSTPPPTSMPPVTPSRHVAAAQARAGAITPPGQPRKTPMARKVAIDEDDDPLGRIGAPDLANGQADEEDESGETDDVLPALNVPKGGAAGHRRPSAGNQRAARAIAAANTASGSGTATAAASGPSRQKVVAASEKTTRMTRSALGIHKKAPLPASPVKGSGSSTAAGTAGSSAPNKLPRLAAAPTSIGATTRAAAKAAQGPAAPPASRRVPPPTPSRLPQLRRGAATPTPNPVAQQLSEAAHAIGKKGTVKGKAANGAEADAWMAQGKDAVVVPKGEKEKKNRPGLRPIRRRRSSFSAADVVA